MGREGRRVGGRVWDTASWEPLLLLFLAQRLASSPPFWWWCHTRRRDPAPARPPQTQLHLDNLQFLVGFLGMGAPHRRTDNNTSQKKAGLARSKGESDETRRDSREFEKLVLHVLPRLLLPMCRPLPPPPRVLLRLHFNLASLLSHSHPHVAFFPLHNRHREAALAVVVFFLASSFLWL